MVFYDESLPQGGEYYFNILVICIATATLDGIVDLWYMDQVTAAYPYIVHFYKEELEEDCDWELVVYPHQVVEIRNNEISFCDMIDFDTEDPWRID